MDSLKRNRVNVLPSVTAGQHFGVEELLQLLEELRLAGSGATLHGSHRFYLIALRSLFAKGAVYVLARLLVDTPAETTIALDTLIATIDHALGHIQGAIAAVLQGERGKAGVRSGEHGGE